MTSANPDWSLYRSFLSVLRTGSLSAAAREEGLTQPTVGRHVDALEKVLGVPLFTRSQHGLTPTEAALELQPYAESLEATAAALVRAAVGRAGTRGTVRITASEVVGAEVLPAILTQVHELHPEITIELVLSNRTEDLLQREADIAVRMVRPTQQALLARHVGDVDLGLHARRDYLERRGVPSSLEELREHTLIGFDRENAFIRSVRAGAFQSTAGCWRYAATATLPSWLPYGPGLGSAFARLGSRGVARTWCGSWRSRFYSSWKSGL